MGSEGSGESILRQLDCDGFTRVGLGRADLLENRQPLAGCGKNSALAVQELDYSKGLATLPRARQHGS